MSHWIEIKKEDIEIDGDDINISLEPDEFGNNYLTIKIMDVLELLEVERVDLFIQEKDV